jgi:betaine-aldehyde dehydrogenase
MNTAVPLKSAKAEALRLPDHREAFYGGEWHKPLSGRYLDSINPGTAESLGPFADCSAADIDAAVQAAKKAFAGWRDTPPGVFNVVPGGREAGTALTTHPGVAMVALIGSVPTGRAVMKAAADTLKPVMLELGGKNALIAFPDADPDDVAGGVVGGMNFTWCGQSCGSTSRAFIHETIYDAVLAKVKTRIAHFKPGIATDRSTTMGAIISKTQYERILGFIESAKQEGARLFHGGGRPSDPALSKGFFIEPTVFADVQPTMRIAREEIFGPVLSIFRWSDEAKMLEDVNAVEYGLTASIWTNDLSTAHRTAAAVQAGFVWINEVSKHFLGAPFGGYKQSGIGREECFEEMLAYTQEKNIHVKLRSTKTA